MKKNMRLLSSVLAVDVQRYIDRLRRTGDYRADVCILKALDAYLEQVNYLEPFITQQVAVDFAYSKPGLTSTQYGRRYQIVRRFADYLSMVYPNAPRLHKQAVPGKVERHPAHIYTSGEIDALLNETSKMRPAGSLRPKTYSTLIGLLVSSGLRIGEAIRLDVDDVDQANGLLRIRNTKFRKSRLVPIHPTTQTALQAYRTACEEEFPELNTPAFFVNQRRKRLRYGTVVGAFIACARRAGIRHTTGLGPRLHDLRHTFAVRRVLEWYRAGEDVQDRLPELATYLGHAHIQDTTYYLSAGSEILAEAAKRFELAQEGGVS